MSVTPIALARLRRADAAGDVRVVLQAVEVLLDYPEHREEAESAFYGVFWTALEGDRRLARRAGRIDLRIGRGAS